MSTTYFFRLLFSEEENFVSSFVSSFLTTSCDFSQNVVVFRGKTQKEKPRRYVKNTQIRDFYPKAGEGNRTTDHYD